MPIRSCPVIWAQLFMSASEAGSSDSISRSCPGVICLIASRVFTMGIGQKSPVQSICLSGLKTLGSCAITRNGTPPPHGPSRKRSRRRVLGHVANWTRPERAWLCLAYLGVSSQRHDPSARPGAWQGCAHVGAQVIMRRLILALSLSSVIPLLVAAYSLYASGLPPSQRPARDLAWVLSALAVGAVSAVVGGTMLWRLLSAGRPAETPASSAPEPPALGKSTVAAAESRPVADESKEEVESLMDSFSRVLNTIEEIGRAHV